jgi:DNA-binding response OmpR family regulator
VKILIADDDPQILRALKVTLGAAATRSTPRPTGARRSTPSSPTGPTS